MLDQVVDGELEVVDLTQEEHTLITSRDEASGLVDLSQLSSSDDDEDREEWTSPERPSRLVTEKTLFRGREGISKLLQMERALRDGLLQRQGPSSTTGRSSCPPPFATSTSTALATSAACVGVLDTDKETGTKTDTDGGATSTAANKGEAAALRKIQKQFESEKYVLKFVKVVLSPALMGGAVGLGIAQAFQQSGKADHELITYEVSTLASSYPLVLWKRMVPSATTLGEYEERFEPFAMLCPDAAMLVGLLKEGGDGLNTVLDNVSAECQRQQCEGEVKVYILAYRLEQYIAKLEQQDHREAVLEGRVCGSRFPGEEIRQALSDLVICRPHVEIFDSSSVEEASSHVVSITKAIALRNCESQGCSSKSKYIAGKSRKQHGAGSALESLLLKDPLPEHATCAVRALTAVPSVTPQIAHVLVKEYGSLRGIYEFLESQGSDPSAKISSLENLRTFGGQRVGPVAARKLVAFLFSDDPLMMIE